MQMKYGEVRDRVLEFLDNADDNFLQEECLILTNGIWDVQLDYNGEFPSEGMEDLKIFVNHKKELIGKMIQSKSTTQILNVAHEVADYFLHRNFTVSVGARGNFLLGILLRFQVFMGRMLS